MINNEKLKKLKEFLKTLSTPEEVSDMEKNDKLNSIENSVKGIDVQGVKNDLQKEMNAIKKDIKNIKPTDYTELLEAVREVSKRISMIKLQDRVDKESPLAYKAMIEKLTSVDEKIGGWKYPQYAYTGLRNKGFSPIDPANNGIGIPEYDSFTLTQTTLVDTYNFFIGGVSGSIVSTLTITYTDNSKSTVLNAIRT